MQRQILINVMIFFAYVLNLPLNTQRPHHRSQRAGKLGLDFGSWQSPDISRSNLCRGTFPWTPPTAIYRAYTVLQKITRAIFCTQFVQCNDGGAADKCMFLSVFTYSSNPLTQICEIVQLTRWAHRKFPPHFLPSSRHKKHGECLLLLLESKFRRSQHVNLKLWLFHVIGVKQLREAECVHWGSETVYVSSPAKMHDVFEFQHSGWFPPPATKRPLWHRRMETFKYLHSFESFCWWHLPFASHAFVIF